MSQVDSRAGFRANSLDIQGPCESGHARSQVTGYQEGSSAAQLPDSGEHSSARIAAADLAGLLTRCRRFLAQYETDWAASVWHLEQLTGDAGSRLSLDAGISLVAGPRAVRSVVDDAHERKPAHQISICSDAVLGRDTTEVRAPGGPLHDGHRSLRAVFPRADQMSEWQRRHLRRLARRGVEVRMMATVPIDLVVLDAQTAALPVDPDHPGWVWAVLEDPKWVSAVTAVAETCWSVAVPYTAAHGPDASRAADDAARTTVEENHACTEKAVRAGAQPGAGSDL